MSRAAYISVKFVFGQWVAAVAFTGDRHVEFPYRTGFCMTEATAEKAARAWAEKHDYSIVSCGRG